MSLPWFDIFVASYFVWVVAACFTLLGERRSPTATLAWIFAFIALPVVSGLYYMVFGPRRMDRKRVRYDRARRALRRAREAEQGREKPVLDPDAAGLASVAQRLDQGEPVFARAAQLIDDGDHYLKELEEAIASAAHHVHMEYYIWEPDTTGARVRDALLKAVQRGVEVRVIYDDVGSSGTKRAFWQGLRDAGGQVRAFNRVRLAIASIHFANFRTHRKIAIIDGVRGFLGGMNIHDAISPAQSGKAAWRDQHVRIDGEPVHRLQRVFLESWNYCRGSAMRLTANNVEKYFPLAAAGAGTAMQVIASGPDDPSAPLHAFFLAALSTARSRVLLQTPYLVPDEPLETALRIAVLRGVDVEVIVPKRGDSRIVTAASHTYCESMRRVGVKVYQYGPPMLHAKTLVIDETVGIVGTANMDNRSFRLNFEIAAVFYDRKLIAQLAKRFEEDRDASRTFPARRRPERLTVLLESIARLTSPVL